MNNRVYVLDKLFLILFMLFYVVGFANAQSSSSDDVEVDSKVVDYVEKGDLEKLKSFIKKNPDIDLNKEYGGWTLLMYASSNGHLEVVKFLVSENIKSVKYSNLSYNHTALMTASENGHLEVVKFLLNYGAKLDEFNKRGDTALLMAINGGHFETIKYLIEQGADIYAGKGSALKLAEAKGNVKIIKYVKDRADLISKFVQSDYRIKDLTYISRDHIILVLTKKKFTMDDVEIGEPIILLKKNKNGGYTEVATITTIPIGGNSVGQGYMGIAVKGDYFTIEQQYGNTSFIFSYATFKYDKTKGKFMLHKYSETYIHRFESQDMSEPTHFKFEKNKYSFEDFTEEFFDKMRLDEL